MTIALPPFSSFPVLAGTSVLVGGGWPLSFDVESLSWSLTESASPAFGLLGSAIFFFIVESVFSLLPGSLACDELGSVLVAEFSPSTDLSFVAESTGAFA